MEKLIAEYQTWCDARGYPEMSADELVCEIQASLEGTDSVIPATCSPTHEDVKWLSNFIERWEDAEDEESKLANT